MALGEQHPDYAASLNNLALLYDAMGRHAEAEPLYKQAMEICRTALGEQHPDYATSLNNLAALYVAMGRHAEAEPLSKQAIEIYRMALGEQHPDYAASLNNLAELYRAMGRHAEAEPLSKQAMEICRTALGEQHPDYATSLNNLAALYVAMGRQAEAEELRKKAMEIRRSARRKRIATRPIADSRGRRGRMVGVRPSVQPGLCHRDLADRAAPPPADRFVRQDVKTGTQVDIDSSCVPVSAPANPLNTYRICRSSGGQPPERPGPIVVRA